MIESMSQSAKSILPQTSVYTRIAVGIVLGFVVLHGFSLVFYGHEKMVSEAGNFAASVVERAMVLNELSHSNPQLIAELESPYFTFEIRDEALARPDRVWPHSDEIRGAVIGQLERMAFERPDQVLTWYTLGVARLRFLSCNCRWMTKTGCMSARPVRLQLRVTR